MSSVHILASLAAPRGFLARRLVRWAPYPDLMRAALREYERDYARYFASAMVYYALISLVPLVLLLLAVLGWMLRLSDLAASAAAGVLEGVEGSFGAPLRTSIEQMLQRIEAGSPLATLVSFGGLLLTASVLFAHLRITFRALWKLPSPLASGSVRGAVFETFLEKSIAFVMVLAGGPLLLGVLVLLASVHWIGGLFANVPVLGGAVGQLLALSSPLLFVPLTFALLFKVLPPVVVRWRHVGFATVLCSAAWMLGAELLTLYAVYFGHNVSAYGALGGVLVIMLWIKTMSQVLFFGAELCKVASSAAAEPTSSEIGARRL